MSPRLLLVIALLFTAACVAASAEEDDATRIVGGSVVTDPTLYPFMVSFQVNRSPFCGGSLIAANVVLTAAHCFTPGQSLSGIVAVVGRIDTQSNSGQEISVSSFTRHPDYVGSSTNQANDLCLVFLSQSATCGSTINPVKLNTAVMPVGTNVTPIGFGLTSDPTTTNATTSQFLKQLTLTVGSCPTLSSGDFCMVAPAGTDSCNGDSGGPVVADNHVLVGITSRGPAACGASNSTPINTRVSSYVSWIQSLTSNTQTGAYNSGTGISTGLTTACSTSTGGGGSSGGGGSTGGNAASNVTVSSSLFVFGAAAAALLLFL